MAHLVRGMFPLKMVIFHSYVSLQEGTLYDWDDVFNDL